MVSKEQKENIDEKQKPKCKTMNSTKQKCIPRKIVQFLKNEKVWYKNNFKSYAKHIPAQIVKIISPFVFRIRLLNGVERTVHKSWLRKYYEFVPIVPLTPQIDLSMLHKRILDEKSTSIEENLKNQTKRQKYNPVSMREKSNRIRLRPTRFKDYQM